MNSPNLKKFGIGLFVWVGAYAYTQSVADSLEKAIHLKTLIQVSPQSRFKNLNHTNTLADIGLVLEENPKVNMIKRGAYAWEPSMDGFTSERLSVTIDNMHIWGACTDKMDPVSSYVETANVQNIEIYDSSSPLANGVGGINIKTVKNHFKDKGTNGSISAGYESNNQQKVVMANLLNEREKYYSGANLSLRKASNYYDGKNREVKYSGFNKINLNLRAGYKINDEQSLHTNFIFDRATDIGFPALTMDVSLAQGIIGSLSFKQKNVTNTLKDWETKVYANRIHHVMDDTNRPIEQVPIYMDMPGKSSSLGSYTAITHYRNNHTLNLKAEFFSNFSSAEMTMYPKHEKPMFMYTWPNVATQLYALYANESISVRKHLFKLSGKISLHNTKIKDEMGRHTIEIFHPTYNGAQQRFLKNLSFGYGYHARKIEASASIGYNERAPSVSEGYGFYLFNNFDNYDYIGNPYLANEKALYALLHLNYRFDNIEIAMEANHYHIKDYIIGKVANNLSPMTLGAKGIKIYTALPYAKVSNLYTHLIYKILPHFKLSTHIGYHWGFDEKDDPLPLISPLEYGASLTYHSFPWQFYIHFHGNAEREHYNSGYGESPTQAFCLLDVSIARKWRGFHFSLGVQNLFNQFYSTYADWNHIPRMGRNFIINTNYTF